MSIAALLEKLRSESNDFPLSVVIYGWGSREAEEFMVALSPSLRREDAVVLLPSQRVASTALPALSGSVLLLNLERPSHRRMYENGHLIRDLVFFGEPGEVEAFEVQRWKGATRAVVVKEGARGADDVLEAARASRLYGWRWIADKVYST